MHKYVCNFYSKQNKVINLQQIQLQIAAISVIEIAMVPRYDAGGGESVSDIGACGVVGRAESARAM